jgi:nicotinamide-nucleotide amidase
MNTDSLLPEAQIGPLLLKRGLKLALAESCTGGLVSHRVTNIPGSSAYYLGSVTAYAYEAKERLLGVRHATLAQFGAVSRETALEMARGVRQVFGPDFGLDHLIGISLTGIAGPEGSLPGKPVGLVWIGMSTPTGDHAWEEHWLGSRLENKELSAHRALELLVEYLSHE